MRADVIEEQLANVFSISCICLSVKIVSEVACEKSPKLKDSDAGVFTMVSTYGFACKIKTQKVNLNRF